MNTPWFKTTSDLKWLQVNLIADFFLICRFTPISRASRRTQQQAQAAPLVTLQPQPYYRSPSVLGLERVVVERMAIGLVSGVKLNHDTH